MSTVTSEDSLLVERDGPVVTVTLNRPARLNAIDRPMWAGLRDTLRAVREDPDVRALVLTGAGEAFSSGADLSGVENPQHPLASMRLINDVALVLHEMPVPTVARVDGVAYGAGWNLALCCDLVVATARSRFCQVFGRRGLSLDFGGSWLLPRLVGMQQAKRLALLAEEIDGTEAHRLGLVTYLAEVGDLDDTVTGVVDRLVAGPPVANAMNKDLLHAGASGGFAEALEREGRSVAINFATDVPAAYAAFVAKRPPEFTGTWRPRS